MKKTKTFLNNSTVVIAISLLASVLIWMMVAYNIDTNIPITIRNVPVTLDTEDSNLARLELYPVTSTNFSVDVEIIGPRATVGNIKATDLNVVAKLNNVSGPGTYDLALEVSDIRNRAVEFKSTVPDIISMRFDHRASKVLSVDLEITGLDIPEGFIMDQEYLYPSEVEVVGPASEMALVDSAKVQLTFEKPLSASTTFDTPVILLDAEGNSADSPYFELDNRNIAVTLPVLKKKVVPVTFDFINVPTEFALETLKYNVSPEEIEIAGPADLVATYNELHLGYLDMRNVAPDMQLSYGLSLPSSFISVEGIEDINIQFVPEGFGEKELSIGSDNIYIVNLSDEYEVTIQSRNIPGVTVFGPEDALETLTSKDLVAQIDMTEADVRTGQITVPVDILIPGNSACWAYGDRYTARVTVKSK